MLFSVQSCHGTIFACDVARCIGYKAEAHKSHLTVRQRNVQQSAKPEYRQMPVLQYYSRYQLPSWIYGKLASTGLIVKYTMKLLTCRTPA